MEFCTAISLFRIRTLGEVAPMKGGRTTHNV